MNTIEKLCADVEADFDLEDIGVQIGLLIGVAFEISETTGVPVPEFRDDPNWFGGCYAETGYALGYKPTLAGEWWIDAPRWAS